MPGDNNQEQQYTLASSASGFDHLPASMVSHITSQGWVGR